MNNSIQMHRVLTAPPLKVFRAFIEPEALASWLPPYGFTCKIDLLDTQVGGTYKMSFINFSTGTAHAFGGTYLELKPGELIKSTDQFENPGLPGQMITTIQLKELSCGTELWATQEGIPEVIPLEMCYLGWQESLDKLKRLVEPNIPDA